MLAFSGFLKNANCKSVKFKAANCKDSLYWIHKCEGRIIGLNLPEVQGKQQNNTQLLDNLPIIISSPLCESGESRFWPFSYSLQLRILFHYNLSKYSILFGIFPHFHSHSLFLEDCINHFGPMAFCIPFSMVIQYMDFSLLHVEAKSLTMQENFNDCDIS